MQENLILLGLGVYLSRLFARIANESTLNLAVGFYSISVVIIGRV